jgi:flavin reductase (DIM6/NTAB) family NADH-FMN oxidoreductase RutF
MTASWGGFGVMFSKNVVYIVIRPHRYTKEFVDNSDTLSLTFFDKAFKNKLNYLGTVSGRDEDKISKANLTIQHSDNTPYFEEGNIVIICKKIYAQEFKTECFIATDLATKWYPEKDYHTFYIAEIQKILVKE